MELSERIIVALDTSRERALELARKLRGRASWLKVGMTLFYAAGPKIVEELKEMGFQVFVDLKLHDIPHQVEGAARMIAISGADMLTVHASGGLAMMQAACKGAEEGYAVRMANQVERMASQEGSATDQHRKRPLCLAITVLTSLDLLALESIGVSSDADAQVLRMAQLAHKAAMDGVVCSPAETSLLRQELVTDFTIVTPGVRPQGFEQGDQARIATPVQAIKAGANYLVIGRPITQAADARIAFDLIVRTIVEKMRA